MGAINAWSACANNPEDALHKANDVVIISVQDLVSVSNQNSTHSLINNVNNVVSSEPLQLSNCAKMTYGLAIGLPMVYLGIYVGIH